MNMADESKELVKKIKTGRTLQQQEQREKEQIEQSQWAESVRYFGLTMAINSALWEMFGLVGIVHVEFCFQWHYNLFGWLRKTRPGNSQFLWAVPLDLGWWPGAKNWVSWNCIKNSSLQKTHLYKQYLKWYLDIRSSYSLPLFTSLTITISLAERALPLPGHHQQWQRDIRHEVSHHLLHVAGQTPAGGSWGGWGEVLSVHDAADRWLV